jgi:hypothetical protein
LTCCVAPPAHLPLPLPSATPAPAVTNRSALTVLCLCELTAARLMAESNSAVFVLLNYKTNFQFCQSMFSAGLVRPETQGLATRDVGLPCRSMGKTEREFRGFFILWNINTPFSHHFPLLLCSSLSIFYLLLFICDY